MANRRVTGLVAAGVIALAACGGNGDQDARTTYEILAEAASATSEAGTARLSVTMKFEIEGESREFVVDGAIDLEQRDATMTMDLAQLGVPGTGEGRVEVRMVDEVVYTDFSALAESPEAGGLDLPEGVTWLKFDPVALAESFGVDPDEMTSSGTDPTSFTDMFEALRGVSRDVEEVGEEEVRGELTTHYRVEIDPRKALEQVPRHQRDQVRDGLALLGDAVFPAEVWVDGEGRVRRMDLTVGSENFGSEDVPAGTEIVFAMEFYDFGVEVEVEAPPAEATADFFDVMTAAIGGEPGED